MNLDFGYILWTQLIQCMVSSTRHTNISCARFWSIIVKRVLDHYKVPLMEDTVIVVILILQTSSFMLSDPTKFNFIGSILGVMLERVP